MNSVVERRKNKFNNFKDLRETGPAALNTLNSSVITPAKEYGVFDRINDIADSGTFQKLEYDFPTIDPLQFEGYLEKKQDLFKETEGEEAVVTGICEISGNPCVLGVMNKKFMMGSMGIEVGERVTRAVELALSKRLPLVLFCASGGARMQEGILSLMQMAKTSAAVEKFKSAGLLYISVLTHPTTGGVSASFATLGDITLAERGALIGFAGPRVIEQTIHEKLPEGFQRAEFQMENGFIDQVVERENMKEVLSNILALHRSLN